MKYTTINIQGNLISEEVLQRIEKGEAQGQKSIDFGFDPNINIRSEIEYAWSRIKLDWAHFHERGQNLPANDPYGTTLSRKWMEQFLSSLGFELLKEKTGLVGENEKSYTISHTATNLATLPIHIVGFIESTHPDKNTLDIKTSGGTSKYSPHGTMQEYLNATEHIYGIATNGLYLRLIRRSSRLIKLTYLEFDLKRMLIEDKYSEFTLLFRLLHATRFPKSLSEANPCILEVYFQESIETGNRIRNGLSLAVKESLVALGTGFLQNENNNVLREKILFKKLLPKDYYRQLLRLIYRFLFLMVAEERDLVYDQEDHSDETHRLKKIYLEFYSIARLRKLSENSYVFEAQFNDLWQGLVGTFSLFEAGGLGKKLGILPLDGELFSNIALADLQNSYINNKLLLECIKNLNEFTDENKNLVPINYRSLDVEELGSVYEGLLDLHPVIENVDAKVFNQINFTFHEGTDRKTTGSYYTKPELVNELIKSALIPVIEAKLKEHINNKEAQIKALLNLKVCDVSSGSGHMLLAAARTIAWYVARVQSGEENPPPSLYRKYLREVIHHCIYAVDYNPDAVELCKLALWIEGHNSGKPLSFLDHKIRNGNSLVGVMDLKVLKEKIPNEAFEPIAGDNKEICKNLKKINTQYAPLKSLFDNDESTENTDFVYEYKTLDAIAQNDIDSVKLAQSKFEELRRNANWSQEWLACTLWTAAFFSNFTKENSEATITSERLSQFLIDPSTAYAPMLELAVDLALKHKFFHWPLEFPDVFEQGGFDVILNNPPWERIKLQQQEFFETRDPAIANAANADERKKLISGLPITNPSLFKEFEEAQHIAEATSKFLRESGRCQLTAVGDINTYPVFTELVYSLVNKKGCAGIIVPTGIATDDSNKTFFGSIAEKNRLISLIDFINQEGIFQINKSLRFCLLTIAGFDIGIQKVSFGFFLTRVAHLQDKVRIFSLSKEDFLLLNPNTKTCPVFRTKMDAELTTKIYKRVPILINEAKNENHWGVKFATMFHMSNDAHLFRTRIQIENEGFTLWGNKMKKGTEVWLPLYEAKYTWSYDHRYETNEALPIEKLNPLSIPIPRNWVSSLNLKNDNRYLLIQRAIADMNNEKRMIFAIIPKSGVGNSGLINNLENSNSLELLKYCSIMNTLVIDYLIRVKAQNPNLNQFILKQMAVLKSSEIDINLIISSIELTYTSWDIKDFADDVWNDANSELKTNIRNQWEFNQAETGGHQWAPPEWCQINPEGCPFPPFKWDENRRATLKAEIDAIYAKLYGLTTDELRYILDPQDVYGPDFPGETFRVLKEKETRLYGEYRTKRLVLEAWAKLDKI